MFRKIITIYISISLNLNPASKALLILMLLSLAVYMQKIHNPFANPDLNSTELRGIIVTLSSIYFGLFYFVTDDTLTRPLMVAAILGLNIYFMVYIFFRLLGTQLEKFVKFLKFCPSFKTKFKQLIESNKNRKMPKIKIFKNHRLQDSIRF